MNHNQTKMKRKNLRPSFELIMNIFFEHVYGAIKKLSECFITRNLIRLERRDRDELR